MNISEKQDKLKIIENYEKWILEIEGLTEWSGSLSMKTHPIHGEEKERINQINIYKKTIEHLKSEQEKFDTNKLYLTEIIKKERPKFGSNNLILAPVGSGKTHLIKSLMKEGPKKILMLVSNTALKNSIAPDDNEIKVKRGDRTYTTQNRVIYGEGNLKVHVMTYAEFGERLRPHKDFAKEFHQIFCDEIHSLPSYQNIKDSGGLALAQSFLFDKHKDIDIFYFTATDDNLKSLERRYPGTLRNVNTFDYRNYPNIKKYMALSEYKINHVEQIRPHLKARRESFEYFGHKVLCYTKTIAGQKRIAEIAKEEGYTPLTLWSINSESGLKLSEEQLKAREHLLIHGKIPEPYDFLIINSAMQEGWNLVDSKVKLAIMNTTNETERTQALGRLRKDVDILIFRTEDKEELTVDIVVPEKYLNRFLTSEHKNKLCKELNIVNTSGSVASWRTLKKLITNEGTGYKIQDTFKTIDGKRTRVSVISTTTNIE